MENRLKNLLQANDEDKRSKWALDWKRGGGKVVGVLSAAVPEEIIDAAGMLPWRVSGSWQLNTPHATAYRPLPGCHYCNGILEALLTDQFHFLDGVVFASIDKDLVSLRDVWAHLGKTSLVHVMYFPCTNPTLAYRMFGKEADKLAKTLESLGGEPLTEDALVASAQLFQRMRLLLKSVYDLRKRPNPPLSGAEFLRLTLAASVMPKRIFVEELEALLPYIEGRRAVVNHVRPRVLVSSDMLDNPAWLETVEDAGCLVAMDDLDTGSRSFWQADGDASNPGDPDLRHALAKAAMIRSGYAAQGAWETQVDQVVRWASEYEIDGVLELPQHNCFQRLFRSEFLGRRLGEAGVPHISIKRDYTVAQMGQMRTRIEAFLEMLQQ